MNSGQSENLDSLLCLADSTPAQKVLAFQLAPTDTVVGVGMLPQGSGVSSDSVVGIPCPNPSGEERDRDTSLLLGGP